MKILLLSIVAFLVIGACASSKKSIDTVEESSKASSHYDESFDPLTLNDNDVVIQKKEHPVETTVEKKIPETTVPVEVAENIEMKEVDGFRVQILAVKDVERASLIQQTAAEQFRAMEYKSYLVFESSLYKVRIGDVTTRSDAEEIRDMAKDYGYKAAFIVPSKVTVPKNRQR